MSDDNSGVIEKNSAEDIDVSTTEETEETAEDTAAEEYEDDFYAEEPQTDENEAAEEQGNTAQEYTENSASEEVVDVAEEKKKINIPWKKIAITAGCIVGAAALIYLSGTIYYNYHFFSNTQIGNYNCSNMSAKKAKELIEENLESYSFVLHEKDGVDEFVTGSEIGLEHTDVKNFDKLIADQKPYMWLFDHREKHLPLDIDVSLNEEMLYNRISELEVAKKSKQEMDGSTAGIYYEDGAFHVNDDGTKDIISVNKMFVLMKNKILDLYKGMVLEEEGCYVGLEGDDTMASVLSAINKFVSTKITYTNGDNSTVLNGDIIHDWVVVGEDYSFDIDKAKINEYVSQLASSYNTVGSERTFKSISGNDIKVAGGDYGWLVDNAKEADALNNLIWEGAEQEREPVYKKTAQTHGTNNDITNTYVEVSIPAQHMWFYKDGNLIATSDVVTGNPLKGNSTHTGVYILKYKERNATLKGEDYETPVSYWMPFNGGEGLHDAPWRGVFGGAIYRGGGSHGCVNLPPSVAAKVFENITPGTPVVVY